MNSRRRRSCTRQWRNLPTLLTIMCAPISTVGIGYLSRHSAPDDAQRTSVTYSKILSRRGENSHLAGGCQGWRKLQVIWYESSRFFSHKCYKNAWPLQAACGFHFLEYFLFPFHVNASAPIDSKLWIHCWTHERRTSNIDAIRYWLSFPFSHKFTA